MEIVVSMKTLDFDTRTAVARYVNLNLVGISLTFHCNELDTHMIFF